MQFVVYGEWRHVSELTREDEIRFCRVFRPDDASLCVWVDPEDPRTLMIGFDVDAASYASAIDVGRAELLGALRSETLADLGAGSLVKVTAMTDEGYRTWSG